jgi:hypothetical protein
MTSASFQEEALGRAAAASNAGTAVSAAARNQNHSRRSGTPIEGGLVALGSAVETVGGVRNLGPLAVEIAVQRPAKRARVK